MSELRGSPERSAHGGPRAARRAVTQLIRLGKSAQVIMTVVCCWGGVLSHRPDLTPAMYVGMFMSLIVGTSS